MDLENEVIMITGGASGIGRAAALACAREGASVVVADINGEAAQDAVQELSGPGQHMALTLDVSDAQSARDAVQAVVEKYGRLDVLCNNAGFGFRGTVETISEEDWDRLMAVNLKGVFLCSKAALPALKRTGNGRIVNTTSYTAAVGITDRAAYVASKGGVSALTRAMALDHVHDGIRVNAVAPGTVDSPYFGQMLAKAENPEDLLAELNGRAPMDRMGRPEEIAEAMVWLASKKSSFATGSILTVDGGTSAW